MDRLNIGGGDRVGMRITLNEKRSASPGKTSSEILQRADTSKILHEYNFLYLENNSKMEITKELLSNWEQGGKEIGRGAFGSVFVAPFNKDRAFAIKKIDKIHSEEKFLQEMTTMFQCRACPDVVYYYGTAYTEINVFFVMELLVTNVRTIIKNHTGLKINEMLLAAVAIPITDALFFLSEELRKIHKDVKPENLLVGRDGAVKLADFGMTGEKKQDASSAATQGGGTTFYFPPEYYKNDFKTRNSAADVWALGLTLYEMVTGKFPYTLEGTQQMLTDAILNNDAPVLCKKNLSAFSLSLCTYVNCCLVKDHQHRWKARDLKNNNFYKENHEKKKEYKEAMEEALKKLSLIEN